MTNTLNTPKNQAFQKLLMGSRYLRKSSSQGFTLVELMVVIVIVGILSAVALPRFLGVRDKAKLNTQIGEATGLAKECASALISEGPFPNTYPNVGVTNPSNSGLTVDRSCVGSTPVTSPPSADVIFTTTAATGKEGAKCGSATLTSGQKCQIKVVVTPTTTTAAGDVVYTAV